jgi:ribulose-phosphate 3-epimerase
MTFWKNSPSNRVLAELSLWSADLARFAEEIERTDPYADLYHIDAADGHFAPFHVHLMVQNNILLNQVEQFVGAGADIITIWYENGDLVPAALDKIRGSNVAAGLSIGLEVPPEAIIPYLNRIELVTMIGTRIGVKGQDLSDHACDRMRSMRNLVAKHGYSDRIKIAADGGNRFNTVPLLRSAGADTIVMGSLAYGSEDLKQTFEWLWSLSGPNQ